MQLFHVLQLFWQYLLVLGRVTILITDKGLSSHARVLRVPGNFELPFICFGPG